MSLYDTQEYMIVIGFIRRIQTTHVIPHDIVELCHSFYTTPIKIFCGLVYNMGYMASMDVNLLDFNTKKMSIFTHADCGKNMSRPCCYIRDFLPQFMTHNHHGNNSESHDAIVCSEQ
eukprot:332132_1